MEKYFINEILLTLNHMRFAEEFYLTTPNLSTPEMADSLKTLDDLAQKFEIKFEQNYNKLLLSPNVDSKFLQATATKYLEIRNLLGWTFAKCLDIYGLHPSFYPSLLQLLPTNPIKIEPCEICTKLAQEIDLNSNFIYM